MRKQVHLSRSRQRVPFIPYANPLELINELSDIEDSEEFDLEEFIDLIERAADGDPDIEVGASPEIAHQLNEYAGREFAHTEKELI